MPPSPSPPSSTPREKKRSVRHWVKERFTSLNSRSITQLAGSSTPAPDLSSSDDGIVTGQHRPRASPNDMRTEGTNSVAIPSPSSSRGLGEESSSPQAAVPVDATPPQDKPGSAHSQSQATLKSNAKTAWHGFKAAAKTAEALVDGTPFKIPIAAVNKLVETIDAVIDNQEQIAELLLPIGERLAIVSRQLSQKSPDNVDLSCQRLTKALNQAVEELQGMSQQGLFKRILEQREQLNQIQYIVRRVDEATKNFELELNLASFRQTSAVKDDTEVIRLSGLHPSLDVRYSALERECCVKGTREGVIGNILSWCNDTSPDAPAVYWLSGMAGTGKSTIAATICERLAEDGSASRLGASFFCSRQVEGGRKRRNILPTVAHELALQLPLFSRALLGSKVDASPPPLKNHLQTLLVRPWDASIRDRDGLPPLVVVLDALDEIENDDGSYFLEELLDSIEKHPDHFHGLKFFVTSRRDPRIVKVAETLPADVVFNLQELPSASAEHDIDVYLRTALPTFAHDQLCTLSKQASGLFIYAATAVRFIIPPMQRVPSPQAQEARLKILLKAWPDQSRRGADGLAVDRLYEGVLSDYLSPAMAPVDKKTNVDILHTLLCAEEPMLVFDIPMLSNEPKFDVENVIQSLHSVLYIFGGRVYSYHKSFFDFMVDPSRFLNQELAELCCPRPDVHFRLTGRCFHLMDSLRFNICDLPSSFLDDSEVEDLPTRVDKEIPTPLRYACRHWAAHMSKIPVDAGEIREKITVAVETWLDERSLFWMEAMNLLTVMRECYPALMSAHKWLGANIKPKMLQDLVAAERLTVVFGSNAIAAATPHLYLSALAVSPRISGLINSWVNRFPRIPVVVARLSRAEPISVFYDPSRIEAVGGFSPDGLRVISGSHDKTVRIWEVGTGQQVHHLNGHSSRVTAVCFSPDGMRAISGSHDTVCIWEVATEQQLQQLNGHSDWVMSVGFSSDGLRAISGSADKTVRIWEVATGQQLQQLDGHSDKLTSVSFSSDGLRAISGSADKTVRIWEVATGQQLQVLNGHSSGVTSVRFSPDGLRAISGSHDETVSIWEVATGQQMQQLNGHSSRVIAVDFSHDGLHAISASDDTTVCIWEMATGQQLKQFPGHSNWVSSVSFSPDGLRAVSSSHTQTMHIWEMATRQQPQLNGHSDRVTSVGSSPDGLRVMSGSHDKTVRIWAVETGQQLQQLNGHSDWVMSVGFSSDGLRAISGSADKTVRIWDVAMGQQLQQLDGHLNEVASVGFSSDGLRAISGSHDKTVRIWDVATGQQLQRLNGHSARVSSAAFSPDGLHAISSSYDKTVRIWEVATGQQLQRIDGHSDGVNAVGFSSDGLRAISGSHDKTVRIWEVATKQQLQQLNGHSDRVTSVGFSPDGLRAISGSHDTTVRIWEVATGQQLRQLDGHSAWVSSVAFSTSGLRVISGSHDNTLRIWEVEKEYRLQCLDSWITFAGQRCLWLPSAMRAVLNTPSCRLISSMGSVSVDLDNAYLGTDWKYCYQGNFP
ncbi:WD40 repeat-like protein [Mycena albidolilacea]|uniref:WD40 repeat-like protein n=1 Tax=Mycena albidolilacea TaxID=1033008 RepID=A0AAD7EAT7_9AGAR|nr:WD40 repeat-like protein [Mycena albidolilacea]